MIRVVIVDDQNTIREFLEKYLADIPGISVVGLASNGKEAILMVKKHLPEIVLMDIEMPLVNGIEATKIISKHFNYTKILLLASKEEKQLLSLALQAGASGYILKTANCEDLEKIIYLTVRGYFQFGPMLDENNYSKTTIAKASLNKTCKLTLVDSNSIENLSKITEKILEIKKAVELQQVKINQLFGHYKYRYRRKNSFLQRNLFKFVVNINYESKKWRRTSHQQNCMFVLGFVLGIMTSAILIMMVELIWV